MKKELRVPSLARPDILFETFCQTKADGTYTYEKLFVERACTGVGYYLGIYAEHADEMAELTAYEVGEEQPRVITAEDIRKNKVRVISEWLKKLEEKAQEAGEEPVSQILEEQEYIYFADASLRKVKHYKIVGLECGPYDFFAEFGKN